MKRGLIRFALVVVIFALIVGDVFAGWSTTSAFGDALASESAWHERRQVERECVEDRRVLRQPFEWLRGTLARTGTGSLLLTGFKT